MYDISNFTDICGSFLIYVRGLELILTYEITMLECNVGAFSSLYDLILRIILKSIKAGKEWGHAFECVGKQFVMD